MKGARVLSVSVRSGPVVTAVNARWWHGPVRRSWLQAGVVARALGPRVRPVPGEQRLVGKPQGRRAAGISRIPRLYSLSSRYAYGTRSPWPKMDRQRAWRPQILCSTPYHNTDTKSTSGGQPTVSLTWRYESVSLGTCGPLPKHVNR